MHFLIRDRERIVPEKRFAAPTLRKGKILISHVYQPACVRRYLPLCLGHHLNRKAAFPIGALRKPAAFFRLSVEPRSAKKRIQSPDGQSWITVALVEDQKDPDGLYTRATVTTGKAKKLSARLDGFRSEVLWAADSRSFIVNQTEGGGGFGQRAYLFQITSNGLKKIDLSTPVERAFGFQGDCELRVLPQTAALGWLAADRILMAAEVVNVSVCK